MQLDRRGFLRTLALLAAPARGAFAPFLRLPYLQSVQADRASVLWTTSSPSGGTVIISDETGIVKTVKAVMRPFLPSETQTSSAFYQYRADIAGLEPGAAYTYRIAMDGAGPVAMAAGQYRFRTAATGKFSFLAFGDTGENSDPQRQVMAAMSNEPNIAMAIHTGDLAYPLGSFAAYESAYFGMNATRMANVALFPTPGNHDYLGDGGAAYLAGHVAPECDCPPEDAGRYYSYDWGDVHFVSMDSNLLASAAGSRMLDWAQRDLARANRFWKIVYFHHPPYPTGHHRDDPFSAIVRERVLPLLESAGVQLVIGGHEHGYERTFPLRAGQTVADGPSTTYVITGGGGAGLQEMGSLPQTQLALALFHYMRFDVDGAKLTGRAIDPTGIELDRFQLAPIPDFSPTGIVNGADFSPGIAPGSLATLFGHNFALREQSSSDANQVDLGGVSLRIAGQLTPLFFVSPTQINFQVPDGIAGSAEVEVHTPNGTARAKVAIAECAPAILSVTPRDSRYLTAYVTGLAAYATELSVWIGDDVLSTALIRTTSQDRGIHTIEIGPLNLAPGEHSLRVAARNSISREAKFTWTT